MQTSIYLAKLMGPVLTVIGLFIVLRPERMRQVGREFLVSNALIFMSGIITLPAGVAIVISHNVWESDWRVLITLFGWITVLAGIARLMLPDKIKLAGVSLLEKPKRIIIPGAVMTALGAILTYKGYL